MRRRHLILLLVLATSLAATAAFAARANFGLSLYGIKIGDAAGGWIPCYGPGKNIVVDGATLHVSYTNSELFIGDEQIRYVYSEDGGTNWEKSVLITEDPRINGNGTHLAVGKSPDDVHFVWGCRRNGLDPARIMYANLSTRTPIAVHGTVNPDDLSRSIAADVNGGVHIVFKARDAAGNWGVYYSRSGDGGATFAEIATLVAPVEYRAGNVEPDVAVDAAGDVYAVWLGALDGAGTDAGVYLSKRSAGAWSAPRSISGPLPGDEYASISIAGSHVAVAWFDWGGPGENDAVAVSYSDDLMTTWNVSRHETEISSFRPGVAVDPTGTINVVWEDQYRGVMFIRSVNGGRTWSNDVSVDPGLIEGQPFITSIDPKVAADEEGRAYVVYSDYDRDTFKFTREE